LVGKTILEIKRRTTVKCLTVTQSETFDDEDPQEKKAHLKDYLPSECKQIGKSLVGHLEIGSDYSEFSLVFPPSRPEALKHHIMFNSKEYKIPFLTKFMFRGVCELDLQGLITYDLKIVEDPQTGFATLSMINESEGKLITIKYIIKFLVYMFQKKCRIKHKGTLFELSITVPVSFTSSRRNDLKEAFIHAGIKKVTLYENTDVIVAGISMNTVGHKKSLVCNLTDGYSEFAIAYIEKNSVNVIEKVGKFSIGLY
jgi:hypothetical protein